MVSTQRIRGLATFCLARSCIFAGLAIAMTMAGLSAWPVLAFQSGAVAASALAAIFFVQGLRAGRRDLSYSEVWLLLQRDRPLLDEAARDRVRAVLRDLNLRCAVWTGWVAMMFWAIAVLLSIAMPLPGAPAAVPA